MQPGADLPLAITAEKGTGATLNNAMPPPQKWRGQPLTAEENGERN